MTCSGIPSPSTSWMSTWKHPRGGTREATFTAPPGTYRFYCRVPAHAATGMRGTLTIR